MKKNALVTGGNSGIGFATAKLLKERGYEVYISGRNRDKIDLAATELGITGLVADMSNLDDVRSLAANFLDSGLDVLVNNAGIAKFIPIGLYEEEDFDEHINTNLKGPLFLIQALLPALEKRGGAITNVSSIVTTHGMPNLGIYSTTKGGIDALCHTLALELAPKGIRINAVSPGAVDTPMAEKFGIEAEQLKEIAAQVSKTIPLQRYGASEELAHVIVSQLESTYTTGAVWVVDGGVSA